MLARQVDLPQQVAEIADVGLRFRYRLLVADANAQALLREAKQLLRRAQRLSSDRLLHSRFDSDEPAFGHHRRE